MRAHRRPVRVGRPLVTPGTAAGLTLVATLTAILHGVGLGTPAPNGAERLLTLRGYLLATAGPDALPGGWRFGWDGGDVAALPTAMVALISSADGAADAAVGPAVAAGRRAALVAAVLGVLLLGLVARRLGLSTPVAVTAALLAGCLPVAVELHRPATPISAATPLLLAAAWAAGTAAVSRSRARRLQVAVVVLVVAAGLVAPVTLVPVGLLVAVLVATGDVGGDWTSTRRTATALGSALLAVGVLTAVWVTAALATPGEPGSGFLTSLSGPGGALTVVVSLAATLTGLAVRWMRPAAVLVLALLTLGLLGAPLVGQGASDLVVLALPAVALLIPTMAATAAVELRRYAERQRLAVLAAAVALAVIGVAALAAPDLHALTRHRPDSPANRAVDWVRTELADGTPVVADDATYARLSSSGDRATWLRELDGRVSGGVAGGSGRPTVVVGRAETVRTAVQTGRGGQAAAVMLAGFGSGSSRVEIWWPDPPSVLGPGQGENRTPAAVLQRRRQGAELAGNPNVRLPTDARESLTRGEVDARVAATVANLAAERRVAVSAFESADGENPGVPATPTRTVLISTIDDQPVVRPGGDAGAETAAVGQLREWLKTQGPEYRPLAVEPRSTADGSVLLAVHFPAPAPAR